MLLTFHQNKEGLLTLSTLPNMSNTWPSTPARQAVVYLSHILCWILGCISAYGIYRFWKLRHLPSIAKRHPKLVLICSASLLFSLCFDMPMIGYTRIESTTSEGLRDTRYITQLLSTQIICLCILFRVYITCVDVSFATAMSRKVWTKHINKNAAVDFKASFLVRNHKTLGNLYRIYPFCIALTLALVIATIALEFTVGTGASWTLYLISTLTLILCTVVFWCCTPKFIDHYRVSGKCFRFRFRWTLCRWIQIIVFCESTGIHEIQRVDALGMTLFFYPLIHSDFVSITDFIVSVPSTFDFVLGSNSDGLCVGGF